MAKRKKNFWIMPEFFLFVAIAAAMVALIIYLVMFH